VQTQHSQPQQGVSPQPQPEWGQAPQLPPQPQQGSSPQPQPEWGQAPGPVPKGPQQVTGSNPSQGEP
jgi:hypothetical protein